MTWCGQHGCTHRATRCSRAVPSTTCRWIGNASRRTLDRSAICPRTWVGLGPPDRLIGTADPTERLADETIDPAPPRRCLPIHHPLVLEPVVVLPGILGELVAELLHAVAEAGHEARAVGDLGEDREAEAHMRNAEAPAWPPDPFERRRADVRHREDPDGDLPPCSEP